MPSTTADLIRAGKQAARTQQQAQAAAAATAAQLAASRGNVTAPATTTAPAVKGKQ